jgi:hypothetical protein
LSEAGAFFLLAEEFCRLVGAGVAELSLSLKALALLASRARSAEKPSSAGASAATEVRLMDEE